MMIKVNWLLQVQSIKDLLQELNSLAFYEQKPPKSLGLEWVKTEIFPMIDSYSLINQRIF